jgi:hypothetical protein
LPKAIYERCWWWSDAQEADVLNLPQVLRPGCDWAYRRATQQRYELSSSHSFARSHDRSFISADQNRKARRRKLMGGAAMCAAQILSGLCPSRVNKGCPTDVGGEPGSANEQTSAETGRVGLISAEMHSCTQ